MQETDMFALLQAYIDKHGHPPKELYAKGEKMTKQESNAYFLSLPIEEQVKEIAKFKADRWKMGRVPAPIRPEIDMSDKREVNMWKAINRRQQFPFLKNEETRTSMYGMVILNDRVVHGAQITNIDTSEDPTIGMVVDYAKAEAVWVMLVSVTDRVWMPIPEGEPNE